MQGSGLLEEFAYTKEELEQAKIYGQLAGKLHTAMHEVIGHASGKINDGVGLKRNVEELYPAPWKKDIADLVALYYIYDQKLVDLGLMPSLELGKAEYDGYIRNGMMLQLRRLELGANVEESHMQKQADDRPVGI